MLAPNTCRWELIYMLTCIVISFAFEYMIILFNLCLAFGKDFCLFKAWQVGYPLAAAGKP